MPNKATAEAKELALAFLTKNYWPALEKRWKDGHVGWPEVQTLLHYGHGKPKELHEITGMDGNPMEHIVKIECVIVDGKETED